MFACFFKRLLLPFYVHNFPYQSYCIYLYLLQDVLSAEHNTRTKTNQEIVRNGGFASVNVVHVCVLL